MSKVPGADELPKQHQLVGVLAGGARDVERRDQPVAGQVRVRRARHRFAGQGRAYDREPGKEREP
jgi:hypothetical protein